MPRPPPSPVSQEVGIELQRVVERWGQLPLDKAISRSVRVLALVQSLADRVAEASGLPSSAVPDLGPAALMDQLTVMVHDASATAVSFSVLTSRLAEDLASLRRELA